MTVRELIDLLSKEDPDLRVIIHDAYGDEYLDATGVAVEDGTLTLVASEF